MIKQLILRILSNYQTHNETDNKRRYYDFIF